MASSTPTSPSPPPPIHSRSAAWLRFPDLTLEPLRQVYTRTGDHTYRYQSPGFETDITIDPNGLVTDYGTLWKRIAQHP